VSMMLVMLAVAVGSPTPLRPKAPSAGTRTNVAVGVEKPKDVVPTDIRRATIIVRDMENSLKLYRDVMGLRVNYDTVVTMSGVALPAGPPGAKARLVLLNGNDPYIGWIGLMQWVDPKLPDPGLYPKRMRPGGVVIITNTDDVPGKCAAAAKVPGVTVTATPRQQIYPGRNGGPPIRVVGCNFFDPDGILIEMNQLQK
jgi:catechol 2,3-dioxygenase-like lactoylglutathione lyase family enzyme